MVKPVHQYTGLQPIRWRLQVQTSLFFIVSFDKVVDSSDTHVYFHVPDLITVLLNSVHILDVIVNPIHPPI